jgi:uncharacterized Zn finger protein
MKKLLGLGILLILAASVFAATVTVTKPAGGETWIKGQPCQIIWTKSGDMPNAVRISLRDKTAATEVKLIADNQPNSGSYTWTVPQDVPDAQYVVRVKVKNAAVSDDSDVFNIAASVAPPPVTPTITVTKPAAGDKWHRGDPGLVTWTKSGTMPNTVKISLMDKNSINMVREIVDGAQNSGSYSWTVPNDVPFGDYRVRVLVKTTSISDDSDTFSIAVKTIGGAPVATKVKSNAFLPPGGSQAVGWQEYQKSAAYLNWVNVKQTTAGLAPAGNAQINARPTGYSTGESSNLHARVGYDYFQFSYPDWGTRWLTRCYRSRVTFAVGEFQGQSDKLIWAKMRVKQIGRYAVSDTHTSCGTGLFIFLAPWTDWFNPSITAQGSGGLEFGSTDYTIDIIDTVRKWLDGSLANNGLLLVSQEVDWGQTPKVCFSSFDVSLTLRLKKD